MHHKKDHCGFRNRGKGEYLLFSPIFCFFEGHMGVVCGHGELRIFLKNEIDKNCTRTVFMSERGCFVRLHRNSGAAPLDVVSKWEPEKSASEGGSFS